MKIACVSDTHGMWDRLNYPPADTLIYAGDILRNYFRDPNYDSAIQLEEISRLNTFCKKLKEDGIYKNIVFVAGNHDWAFQLKPQAKDLMTDVHYLQDSGVKIDGAKFWGSPWQPWFYDWAFNFPNHHANFMKARAHARNTWGQIPDDTDVLITHGPPQGVLDMTFHGEEVGCPFLIERIGSLSLKLHVFGHIHFSYGQKVMGGFGPNSTIFLNAAACNEAYQPDNPIQVVEVKDERDSI